MPSKFLTVINDLRTKSGSVLFALDIAVIIKLAVSYPRAEKALGALPLLALIYAFLKFITLGSGLSDPR